VGQVGDLAAGARHLRLEVPAESPPAHPTTTFH
jgi:hypothetical protein